MTALQKVDTLLEQEKNLSIWANQNAKRLAKDPTIGRNFSNVGTIGHLPMNLCPRI